MQQYTNYLPYSLTRLFERPAPTLTFQEKMLCWIKQIFGQECTAVQLKSYATTDIACFVLDVCFNLYVFWIIIQHIREQLQRMTNRQPVEGKHKKTKWGMKASVTVEKETESQNRPRSTIKKMFHRLKGGIREKFRRWLMRRFGALF
ncbi:hypothetical protein L798_09098 [Zootermopsis nevadensis]|uniref:Uncharacterized protein n=1 Tax=Zootermopsis nevadensis TaxID=136037 RepID=A0A067R3R9_ZOONE|nr:hypothetical protein L798_09098 [Zootermopsis nevadensis]